MQEQVSLNNQVEEKINERRFELPIQDEAKARLDTFRTTVKELQKENPEILGATVYGSMIKGKQARAESDVDSFLYVDAENPASDKIEADSYRQKLLEKLGAENNENSKYYEDVRVQPLSTAIIEKEIEDQLSFYEKNEEYKRMLSEKYGEASDEEKETLLRQEPDFRTIQFGISGMFHARVGSGIEKYRKVFIEKIATMPDKDTAEKLWSEVASQIRTMEQRKDPNVVIDTPDTLKDAIRKFDPEFYAQMQKNEDQEKIQKLRQETLEILDSAA
ncbi:MAG: nucleotidyltransferase domain-containing protein [Patescibacteria group bacterium]